MRVLAVALTLVPAVFACAATTAAADIAPARELVWADTMVGTCEASAPVIAAATNVAARRCCKVMWENRLRETCEDDPNFAGLECARGWDWNNCTCIGATTAPPTPTPRGETPIRINPQGVPGGTAGTPGTPQGGSYQLPANWGTLVCGCYGATSALGQLRVNTSCPSGYDKIMPCLGQCQDGSVPYGARCYDATQAQVAAPSSGLLPSGTGTLACGCHAAVYLWQSRPNGACASGYDMILPCLGQCSGGGVPWGARCL